MKHVETTRNDTEIAELAQKASPKVIWPIWDGLQPVQRADVFRYLVLWWQGGYYADVDVSCKKPIDQYKLPASTNMIVGYEFGHRFPEWQRRQIKFARTEQFQQSGWCFGIFSILACMGNIHPN